MKKDELINELKKINDKDIWAQATVWEDNGCCCGECYNTSFSDIYIGPIKGITKDGYVEIEYLNRK